MLVALALPGPAAARLVRLRDSAPPVPSGTRSAPAPGGVLRLTVTLRRHDERGFRRFLRRVQDPREAAYRHYLSQRALTARFGPSRRAYDRVRAWLRAGGLRVTAGSRNRLTVTARGPAAAVERALHVGVRGYQVGGRTIRAVAGAPLVPAGIAARVRGIGGLSDLARPRPSSAAPRAPPLIGPQYQNTYDVCSFGGMTTPFTQLAAGNLPAAIANAFGFVILHLTELSVFKDLICLGMFTGLTASVATCSSLIDPSAWKLNPACNEYVNAGLLRGRRRVETTNAQKLGIVAFDSFHRSDVEDFVAHANPTASTPLPGLSTVEVDGGAGAPGAGEAEVLLDIDVAMLFAPLPDTSYVVYEAPPSATFESVFNRMIGDGMTVITNSWSACEDQVSRAEAESIDAVLAQAAAGGVSVFNASGDSGSTCLDGAPDTVGVPADSPHATAVGGTTPEVGPGLEYKSERWWDGSGHTPPTGTSGFGVSRYFTRPAYQDGKTTATGRSVPDVVTNADPAQGMAICQASRGGCPSGLRYGGTSLSAPKWAAITVFLNRRLGRNVGEVNPAVYPLAGTAAFHDAAGMGSDFAHVGIGSFDFDRLTMGLAGRTAGPVDPALSVAAAAGPPGVAPLAPFDEVPADGSATGIVRVDLSAAHHFPVSGKTVTLTASAGSHAQISAASGLSDSDGTVLFSVTDDTVERVTFTARDTTDGVDVANRPQLHFVSPAATGASIVATPPRVVNDGTDPATINVYLQDARGRPAVGKTVKLTASGGTPTLTPASGEATTGDDGTATFTATDTTNQTVQFTAVDATDGNLPVPGSATVNFEPPGPPCSDARPTGSNGVTATTLATGFPINDRPLVTNVASLTFTLGECAGLLNPAVDPSGNLLLPDTISGQLTRLAPGAGSGTDLPGTSFAPGGQLGGVAYGESGQLYAGLSNTDGDFHRSRLVELDPASGAIRRTVVTNADGLAPCPDVAVDPLSGDVFTTSECTGALASSSITRVGNPDGATPTATSYVSTGQLTTGIAFAPDGTLYLALINGDIVSVTGTDTPAPVKSTVASVPHVPSGVDVLATDGGGRASTLAVSGYDGTATRVDVTASPATQTDIAGGGASLRGIRTGPDGCLYASQIDALVKLAGPGCAASAAGPQVTLTADGPASAATGSSASFTATLRNVASPAGAVVRFVVGGPNGRSAILHADAAGKAAFAYSGVFRGVDEVVATTTVDDETVASVPARVRWTAGKATTFLTLAQSPQGGRAGAQANIRATLVDASVDPPAPLAGQALTLGLNDQRCTVTTNGDGTAACALSPPASVALATVSAHYGGSATYTASDSVAAYLVRAAPGATPTVTPSATPAATPTPTPYTLPRCTVKPKSKRVQLHRRGRRGTLALRLRCDVPASATLAARLKVKRKHKRARVVRARKVRRRLSADKPVTVKLRLPKRVLNGLKHRARVSARFTLTATGVTGRTTARARIKRVRLRKRRPGGTGAHG